MKKKVMIVDDEQDLLKILKLNLEDTNQHKVMTLSDARGIVKEVHRFKPDVISLDLNMPHIGGKEVCEMLKNDPVCRKTPVIHMTAYEDQANKIMCDNPHVMEYLIKPVTKPRLLR